MVKKAEWKNGVGRYLVEFLNDSNFDPWESVSSVLEHAGERSQHLQAHILETKLLYWNLMATTLRLEPPTTLLELMHFESKIITSLNLEQRNIRLEYSGRVMTVGALIRLSARHSVWHAGQIALTRV